MDRRQKILGGLNPSASIGAEIGPLHNALIRKDEGAIFYVDHCDTAALKARWSTDQSVDIEKLHVDAVWGTRNLREAIDASELAAKMGLIGARLDYVIASMS